MDGNHTSLKMKESVPILVFCDGEQISYDVTKNTSCNDVINMAAKRKSLALKGKRFAIFNCKSNEQKALSGNTKLLKKLRSTGVKNERFMLEIKEVDDMKTEIGKTSLIGTAFQRLKWWLRKCRSNRESKHYVCNNLNHNTEKKVSICFERNISISDDLTEINNKTGTDDHGKTEHLSRFLNDGENFRKSFDENERDFPSDSYSDLSVTSETYFESADLNTAFYNVNKTYREQPAMDMAFIEAEDVIPEQRGETEDKIDESFLTDEEGVNKCSSMTGKESAIECVDRENVFDGTGRAISELERNISEADIGIIDDISNDTNIECEDIEHPKPNVIDINKVVSDIRDIGKLERSVYEVDFERVCDNTKDFEDSDYESIGELERNIFDTDLDNIF